MKAIVLDERKKVSELSPDIVIRYGRIGFRALNVIQPNLT